MKPRLLSERSDFGFEVVPNGRGGLALVGAELSPRADSTVRDLGLRPVLEAMAGGDALVYGVCQTVLLGPLGDPGDIAYRQAVLADFVAVPEVVGELYRLAAEAVTSERGVHRPLVETPAHVLAHSVQVLGLLLPLLRRLRDIADEHVGTAASPGLRSFFLTLQKQLDDRYFGTVEEHLQLLRFEEGTLISARLGRANRGAGHTLRSVTVRRGGWRGRLGLAGRSSLSFEVNARDEKGLQALAELSGKGLRPVAEALSSSTQHVLEFFKALGAESGFYLGCVNLYDRLRAVGAPVCVPVPEPASVPVLSYRGLYDVALVLRLGAGAVGNDADADGKRLVMVTGANSGGKSTLLRSIGTAYLMMQSGMFVGAEAFRAEVASGIFTHFIREEDKTLRSGKLDEELARMSAIVDQLRPGALVLFNESFGATNEREGSELARQVVDALLDAGIRVVFVTHLYTLASNLYRSRRDSSLFLRAERGADGQRTYKLTEGEPLPTGFGEDVYHRSGGWHRPRTGPPPAG